MILRKKESRTQVHIIRLERLRNHSFKVGNYNLRENKQSHTWKMEIKFMDYGNKVWKSS